MEGKNLLLELGDAGDAHLGHARAPSDDLVAARVGDDPKGQFSPKPTGYSNSLTMKAGAACFPIRFLI